MRTVLLPPGGYPYAVNKYIIYRINVEKYSRAGQTTDDSIIWRMRIACWITKATNTHSEYVIFIARPLQQWLQERTLLLRYTYIVTLYVQCQSRVTIPLLFPL
jgi:hypothetical protein